MHGSISVARSLLAADLVDRLELVVAPTVAGAGRRLFTDAGRLQRLSLRTSRQTDSGCLLLGYTRP